MTISPNQIQKPWFVYIAECGDGSLYTGVTNDVKKRIEKHNSGKGAKYTKFRGPVKLVYFEKCFNRSQASIRESEIKKLTRIQKLKLIEKAWG
jgi:putative endonuclease